MRALKNSMFHNMQNVTNQINDLVNTYYPILKKIEPQQYSLKPNAQKWSKKEELGHLIDSALNNLHRFIRVQYESNVHIIYHPDQWVNLNDYQNRNVIELTELWYLTNKQIITVLEKMPSEKWNVEMSIGNDISNKNTTLYIAEDYVKHMTHHLKKITSL